MMMYVLCLQKVYIIQQYRCKERETGQGEGAACDDDGEKGKEEEKCCLLEISSREMDRSEYIVAGMRGEEEQLCVIEELALSMRTAEDVMMLA